MYIPLRVLSPFSIGYGAIKTSQLAEFCVEHGIPAAGICDLDTLSGIMTNAKTLRAHGIQPLTGATYTLRDGDVSGQLVFFAKSERGYKSMLAIANKINTRDEDDGLIDLGDILDLCRGVTEDLIVLTGGKSGLATNAIAKSKLDDILDKLLAAGFDLYVEIERNTSTRAAHEDDLIAAADAKGVPLVATSRSAYLTPDLMDVHDSYLCIVSKSYKASPDRPQSEVGLHIPAPIEMEERFSDLPNAIANTIEIARKAGFMTEPQDPRIPSFPVAPGQTEAQLLEEEALAGLDARLDQNPQVDAKAYRERLDYELGVISSMGFAGYFLIVSDFINWAKSQDIPVGPGRGSGAGSLVAYALGITDIDPCKFSLLFERFLNPDRVSLPDFDIDFCKERREEVIDYVRSKYGEDKVAHIAAFGSLQARAVVKAVGRVHQVPYKLVEQYAKMIPNNPANPVSLAEAMEGEELADEIDRADPSIRAMFETAVLLEGLFSHVSTHAAGVIISDRPVADVVPVHIDHNGKLATSYEMKAAESAGLVKFDFLGLKNLDAIYGARKFIREMKGVEIDFDKLDFQDPKTYANLAAGDGFGVFQLESAGMSRAMRELKVENIDELIALISLYRPGPMENIPVYAAVKSGAEKADYLHPEMEAVLAETNGVMIYQEQVMQISRSLAGYTLGEADILRRAMGKKIQSQMDDQRSRFLDGASAGWVDVELDDGTTKRLHAHAKLPATDGSGRVVTLQQALDEGIEVSLTS